jgi:hypothetical protein
MNKRFYLIACAVFIAVSGILVWFFRPIHPYGITAGFSNPVETVLPKGLASPHAVNCGACHQEIYEEWKASIHANAWRGDYFQIDWHYDDKKQNCLNCHTPMDNQQPHLIKGFENGNYWKPILEPNPAFDPKFQKEGVTCLACHLRDGKIAGPHGMKNTPHETVHAPEMKSGSGVCVRCHIAPDAATGGNLRICSMEEEILQSDKETNCIDCHMPRVKRPLVAGGSSRIGRKHTWHGGHNVEKVRSALSLRITTDGRTSNSHRYKIMVLNKGTHHRLPSGMPDRHIDIAARIEHPDGTSKELFSTRIVRRIIWRPIPFTWKDNRLKFNEPRTYSIEIRNSLVKKGSVLRVTAHYGFIENWRRHQIRLPERSHRPYLIHERTLEIDKGDSQK